MPGEHRSKTDRNVLPVRSGLLCRVVDPVFATLQNCLLPAHDHRRSAHSSNRVHLTCLELLTKPSSPSPGLGRGRTPARANRLSQIRVYSVGACLLRIPERKNPPGTNRTVPVAVQQRDNDSSIGYAIEYLW
jgi:hypothetical protein